MLKIHDLRQAAYASWELLCGVKGVYTGAPASDELPVPEAERLPWTNPVFKAEIRRRYGDIRRRCTWEEAAIDLTAHQVVHSYLEPYQIVGYMASPTYMQCEIREHYGDQVIERMWQFPETAEIVRAGLNQVYGEATADPARPDPPALESPISSPITLLPGALPVTQPSLSRTALPLAAAQRQPMPPITHAALRKTRPLAAFRQASRKAGIYNNRPIGRQI
jgi:hypothetical protein